MAAIIGSVRQLITRIDDELHRRLRLRAAADGRSMNEVVVDAIRRAVDANDRVALEARLLAAGWRVVPPRPDVVPSSREVKAAVRGTGKAVSEALRRERAAR